MPNGTYLYPLPTNVTDINGIFTYIATPITGAGLPYGEWTLFTMFTVALLGFLFYTREFVDSLMGASTIGLIVSGILTIMGILNVKFLYASIILFAVALILIFIKKNE